MAKDNSVMPSTPGNTSLVDEVSGLSSLSKAAEFLIAENLIPKRKVPYTVSEVMTMLAYGKQLNMDPITAVNALEFIEGNLSMKSRMIAGVLARAGVAIRLVKDYEPIYEEVPVTIKGADGKPLVDEEGRFSYYKNPDGSTFYKKQEVDRETVIEFIRYFDSLGTIVTNQMTYKLSYAKKAELADKSNWIKNVPYMMFARCLSRGARAFASDVVFGLYDDLEVRDFTYNEPRHLSDYSEVPTPSNQPFLKLSDTNSQSLGENE